MKSCSCSLAGTDACKTCNNTFDYESGAYDWYPNPYEPYTVPAVQPQTRKVKRTTKTIEKYGPDGEYLGKEVITEEVENFERQVYDGTFYIQGTSTDCNIEWNNVSSDVTNWDPNDPKNNWSYTNTGGGVVNFSEN